MNLFVRYKASVGLILILNFRLQFMDPVFPETIRLITITHASTPQCANIPSISATAKNKIKKAILDSLSDCMHLFTSTSSSCWPFWGGFLILWQHFYIFYETLQSTSFIALLDNSWPILLPTYCKRHLCCFIHVCTILIDWIDLKMCLFYCHICFFVCLFV